MFALTITASIASVLLLAVETSSSDMSDTLDETIAQGLAQQLLDEIMQRRYIALGDLPTTAFGRSASDNVGPGRSTYNDTDDYHAISLSPPQARNGQLVGQDGFAVTNRPANFQVPTAHFSNWRQRVTLAYLDPSTLAPLPSGTSNYRCVEVAIERRNGQNLWLPLAVKKRIIAYVPPGP